MHCDFPRTTGGGRSPDFKTMRACVLHDVRALAVRNVPTPQLGICYVSYRQSPHIVEHASPHCFKIRASSAASCSREVAVHMPGCLPTSSNIERKRWDSGYSTWNYRGC